MPDEKTITYLMVGLCLIGFLLTVDRFYQYQLVYSIPFGKLDVDNYMTWMGEDRDRIEWLTETKKLFGVDVVHQGFISTVNLLVHASGHNHTLVLTYFIPFLLWFVMPSAMMWFAYSVTLNLWSSFESMLFLLFGTFLLFFFGVCSVWSQFFSFIPYLLAAGCLIWVLRGVGVMIPFALGFGLLSILYHPLMLGAYGLMLMGELMNRRKYLLVLLLWVCVAVGMVWLSGHGMYVFRGNVPIKEPPLYGLLYVFTSPLVVFFTVIGFINSYDMVKRRFKWYILFTLFLTPWISLMRNVIVLYPFACVYGVLGFRRLRSGLRHSWAAVLVFYGLLLNHFNYVFWYFIRLMVIEFNVHHPEFDRGLPARMIVDLFRGYGI